MKWPLVNCLLIAVFATASGALTRQDPQPTTPTGPPEKSQPADGVNPDKNLTLILERLNQIDSRLDSLEKVVFATAKIAAVDAERRVQEAEDQLRASRQLFLKGMVAEGRWRQDEFRVELMKRELELIRNTSRQRLAVSQMEVLQAEQNLQLAADQLNYLQNLATRGYASIDQVRENERFVADSKSKLQLARDKLTAAEELESVSKESRSDKEAAAGDSPGSPPK